METMNNNIQEQRVSSDNAKRLKEKGFDVKCNRYIDLEPNMAMAYDEKVHIYVPTQQLALDWIRVNFGIHIEVFKRRGINGTGYNFMCIKAEDGEAYSVPLEMKDGLKTPEEAKEAAISFFLA